MRPVAPPSSQKSKTRYSRPHAKCGKWATVFEEGTSLLNRLARGLCLCVVLTASLALGQGTAVITGTVVDAATRSPWRTWW